MPGRRRLATAPVALFLATARSAYAFPDELEVRFDEVTPPGRVGAELFMTYVPSRPPSKAEDDLRSAFHLLQASPASSFGIVRDMHVEFQVFTSVGPREDARVDGARAGLLMVPVRPRGDAEDGYWAGLLVEIGHLPRTISENRLDAEVKVLLGMRRGRWAFGVNPEIQAKISGRGPGQTASRKLGRA